MELEELEHGPTEHAHLPVQWLHVSLPQYATAQILCAMQLMLPLIETDNIASGYREKKSRNTVLSHDKDNLSMKIDGKTELFPLIWLRDNCTCEKCFHSDSQSRIINWNQFDINVGVKSVEKVNDKNIEINWNDNHKSVFSYMWLSDRSFLKDKQQNYLDNVYKPKKVLWEKNDFNKILRRYIYKDVLEKDDVFYNYLKDLATYGLVLIENAPIDKNEFKTLAKRIAFIRKTHYGEDFHVTAKPGTSNVAYLSSLLQLHTDLPYYEYKPGTTFLHCITQTESKGGDNLFSDTFYVAEKLRDENNEVFDILSTTEVNWSDLGEEDGVKFNTIYRSPMIILNSEGNIEKVRHSIPQRGSHFTVDLQNVKPWYKGLRLFIDLINKHACQFKSKPGDIIAFDNIRTAHGRLPYEDTATLRRFLVGFYVDWDEIYSTMRILQASTQQTTIK